jgi:hypothetical protein
VLRRIVIAAATVSLVLPAGAQADALGPVLDLSADGEDAYTPEVAVDSGSNATVVWLRFNVANDVIQVRRITADGMLGPVQDLSAAGQSANDPHVAVGPNGNAMAVWQGFDGTNTIVQGRRIAADGALGPVRDLSAAGADANSPRVAADTVGNAIAVWRRFNGSVQIVQTRRIGTDGTLGATQDLSAPGQYGTAPQVAVNPAGNAVAVWHRFDGTKEIVQARRIGADGSIGATQDLSPTGQDSVLPQVAVDGAGNATAVWRGSSLGIGPVQARRVTADGSLGPIQDLSAMADGPRVAIDPAGIATATWQHFDGSNLIVQERRIAADGALGTIQDLSAPGQNGTSPQLAVDAAGVAIVTWQRGGGGTSVVQARRIAADDTRRATEDLSRPGQFAVGPQVAVDPTGDAAFVWKGDVGANNIIEARQLLVPPSCQATSAATPFQTATTVALRCSGLRFSRQIVSGPAHGSLGAVDEAAGTVTYTPAAGYSGGDQFAFKAVNAGGESATVLAAIDVGAAPPGSLPPALIVPTTGRAVAALFGRTLRFKLGKATERVRCDNVAGDQCSIAATLVTGRANAARRKRKPKPKTLARAAATIAGGQTATITWRLTAAGRKALRRKRVTATLGGTSRNRAGETVQLAGRRTLVNAPVKKKTRR